MTSRYAPLLLAATLLLVLGACRTGREIRGEPGNPFQDRGAAPEVTFRVTNLAFSQATLYAVAGADRRLLGRVAGLRDDTFTMPLPVATTIHMEIDLLAGPRCYTEEVSAEPGDTFELTIQQEGQNLRCGSLPQG